MNFKPIFQLFLILLFFGCTNSKFEQLDLPTCVKTSPNTIMFNYQDFGLQSTAYEVIGFEWWQWQSCGEDCEKEICPIKVIVYRGLSLDEVKVLHPVNEKKKLDYRYLHYNKALNYLEVTIKIMEVEAENMFPEVSEQLKQTKYCIIDNL